MGYRDINYKALTINNEIVFGYYFYNKSENKHYIMTNMSKIYEIKEDTVCQYIGLKTLSYNDMIYEGDVIIIKGRKYLVEPIGSEERDGDQYGLCVSSKGDGNNYFIDESILRGEVIGNIFIDGDGILQ